MTKTIFITGATAGIGRAAARRFAADGWTVIGTGRREDRLAALAAELGDRFRPVALDMRDIAAVEAAAAASGRGRPVAQQCRPRLGDGAAAGDRASPIWRR